jgi:hypothetical protein
MVFTDDIADDAGGFLVRLAVLVPQLVHGEEDAALYGLETVPHVRQGAPHDHAHGVVEVALAHLVLDGAGLGGLVEQVHEVAEAPSGVRIDAADRRLTTRCYGVSYHIEDRECSDETLNNPVSYVRSRRVTT